MIKIRFPDGENVLDHLSTTLGIINEIEKEAQNKNSVSLDLTDVHWFIPCSMILISNKIRELLDRRVSISYTLPTNLKAKEHMEKIGFPLGNKTDGGSYVSIKHFKKDKREKNQVNKQVNELLNSIESKLPYQFGDSIKYIFGEISDNIDEHSEFEYASLMAQYYPTKRIVDIAIFDNGVSIPALFEEHKISFKDDSDAIKKAVWGEATTKKNEQMRGYGLRTCKNLSTEGLKGELHIVSRKGILVLKSKEKPIFHQLKEKSLKGTFLYFRLKTPKEKLNIYEFVE